MQPVITQWKKDLADDVNLRHVPASMRRDWETHAQAFYVARELGLWIRCTAPCLMPLPVSGEISTQKRPSQPF